MKKLLFHAPPWGNRWIPYVCEALSKRFKVRFTDSLEGNEVGSLSEVADVLVSGWANGMTAFWTKHFSEKTIVTFVRRYEVFDTGMINEIDWSAVNGAVFVSNYWHRDFKRRYGAMPETTHVAVIPNGIDTGAFPLRKSWSGKNIAMVCQLRHIKNIPLACQILERLPLGYRIFHIGLPSGEGEEIKPYVEAMRLTDRFIFEGEKHPDEVCDWLEDKDCILSTSTLEGNPNNILEAMARGVKPVIHTWPGAMDQFGEYTFRTIDGAVELITSGDIDPEAYREFVKEHYSLDNFRKFADFVEEVHGWS
jgi:glycosyltransferase involved in cell wall biosynthesis